MNLQRLNKFWVSLAAPLGVLLLCLGPTETEVAFVLTVNELYTVLVALAASVGVYVVPNKK